MPKTLKDDITIAQMANLDTIALAIELKTSLAKEYLNLAIANTLLFDRKQFDYGPGNIAKFGTPGCVIRASDKFERVAHLFKANRKRPANESLIDSYRDIHVYMNIICMIEQKLWPGL